MLVLRRCFTREGREAFFPGRDGFDWPGRDGLELRLPRVFFPLREGLLPRLPRFPPEREPRLAAAASPIEVSTGIT